MQTKATVIFADEITKLLNSRLPINNSVIPLSIILKTMRYHLDDDELSFKKLYSEVKSSEIGARIHVSRLVNTNWIQIEKSTNDFRVKVIKPTEKMLDTFNSLSNEIRHKLLINEEKQNLKRFKSFIKR
jgi:hypothetical protein